MKIAIGCDHAAFSFKEEIKAYLEEKGHQIVDKGCYSPERADYPTTVSLWVRLSQTVSVSAVW